MPTEVTKFLKKMAIFVLPFVLYSGAIVLIDPFNYFKVGSPVRNDLKEEISFKLNYAMWKMFAFRQDPSPDLLLGDSRMMDMDAEAISSLTEGRFYNFAYGGGSLKEAIATIRFADDLTHLESITIGLDLNSYNGSDVKDRVSEVLGAMDNPFLYITNNNVMISAWKLMTSTVSGQAAQIGQPVGDRDAFWQSQLDVTARVYFSNYRDPVLYRTQLQEVAQLCREKEIKLSFIIFPSHKDLMDKIRTYDLEEANRLMRSDLAALGTVYDFAWENESTRSRDNFKDPYHFTPEVMESIIGSVWGNTPRFVRIYGSGTGHPDPETSHLETGVAQ